MPRRADEACCYVWRKKETRALAHNPVILLNFDAAEDFLYALTLKGLAKSEFVGKLVEHGAIAPTAECWYSMDVKESRRVNGHIFVRAIAVADPTLGLPVDGPSIEVPPEQCQVEGWFHRVDLLDSVGFGKYLIRAAREAAKSYKAAGGKP